MKDRPKFFISFEGCMILELKTKGKILQNITSGEVVVVSEKLFKERFHKVESFEIDNVKVKHEIKKK